jgi:hypothetical protein
LRSHDGRVDEAKEEETADKRAYSAVVSIRVLPLFKGLVRIDFAEALRTHLSQTADLFANPSDTIRNALQGLNNRRKEAVSDLHEDVQPRGDDTLHVGVRCCGFGPDSSRKILGQRPRLFLNLSDHLLVNLGQGR